MVFYCRACQRKITGTDSQCPFCKAIQNVTNAMRCGHCGKVVDVLWRLCPYCGGNLLERKAENRTPSQPREVKRLSPEPTEEQQKPRPYCGQCGKKLEPAWLHCPHCGASLAPPSLGLHLVLFALSSLLTPNHKVKLLK